MLAACEQPQATIAGPAGPRDLSQYLTRDAAESLNADGLFSVSSPAPSASRPTLAAERAGELALAYVRSFGPSLRGAWEKDRGAPVDLANLRVASRILYAATPYGAFPDGHHPGFVHALGPYYLVPLGSGSEPELLVAVAAYATATSIDPRGLIQRPVQRGNEFVSRGIPVDTGGYRLVSPEEAVEMVGRATGARIARAPELVRQGMPAAPVYAAWKLTLDRDVPVQARDGGRSRVRELYVSPERGRSLMVPVRGGPRTEAVPAVRADARDGAPHEMVQVPVRTGEAVSFQPVTAEEGGL